MKRTGLIWGTLLVAALALLTVRPLYRSQRRERGWRQVDRARLQLLALASAQRGFAEGDLDGDGSRNYWTANVEGLAEYGLIDPALARADLGSSRPVPLDGYYYVALKYEGPRRFGFAAIPVNPEPWMKTILINEDGYPIYRYGAWEGDLRWPAEDRQKLEWGRCWGG